MPRTKLDPEYWRKYGRDAIYEKVTQQEIADALGKSQPSVCNSMKTLRFTLPEFRKIVELTGLTDEQVLRIIK